MATYNQRRRPLSVATVNFDIDDMETTPREEYRPTYDYEEATPTSSSVSSHTEKRKSRSHWKILIVVLIIIALISIVGMILGIYCLVLITTQLAISTTAPTISATSTTALALTCSSSPSTYYQYSTATPAQCLNYTNNSDATRNIAYAETITYCDNTSPFNSTNPQWIRFFNPAGTLLISSPASPNHCGTVATGWYAGQYPTAFYTTATSIVCYYYSTHTCIDCSLISITNCRYFYVYLLPQPPACNYRYCTL